MNNRREYVVVHSFVCVEYQQVCMLMCVFQGIHGICYTVQAEQVVQQQQTAIQCPMVKYSLVIWYKIPANSRTMRIFCNLNHILSIYKKRTIHSNRLCIHLNVRTCSRHVEGYLESNTNNRSLITATNTLMWIRVVVKCHIIYTSSDSFFIHSLYACFVITAAW